MKNLFIVVVTLSMLAASMLSWAESGDTSDSTSGDINNFIGLWESIHPID